MKLGGLKCVQDYSDFRQAGNYMRAVGGVIRSYLCFVDGRSKRDVVTTSQCFLGLSPGRWAGQGMKVWKCFRQNSHANFNRVQQNSLGSLR